MTIFYNCKVLLNIQQEIVDLYFSIYIPQIKKKEKNQRRVNRTEKTQGESVFLWSLDRTLYKKVKKKIDNRDKDKKWFVL